MSSPTSCLEDAFIDGDVILLRPAIRRFVIEAKTTHSVDGYLILLGGLVFEIEEFRGFRMFDYDSREILKKILSCAEVVEALSPLANYIEDVRDIVYSSPRHKSLRSYLDIITETLSKIPPSEKKLEVLRPPLSVLDTVPSTKPESRTRDLHYIPVETAESSSTPIKSKKEVIRRIPGYILLIILSAGIIYFSYALLIKYGLIEPLPWIPLP